MKNIYGFVFILLARHPIKCAMLLFLVTLKVGAEITHIRLESAGAHAISGYAYGYHRVTIGTNVVYFGTGGAGLSRGWVIVTLDASQITPTPTVMRFDPWGNEAEAGALADYLTGLPRGMLVLICVCDEAGVNFWDVCDLRQSPAVQRLLTALASLGAGQASHLCYRDSYGLATVTGDGYFLFEEIGKFKIVDFGFDVAFGRSEPFIVTQPVGLQFVKSGDAAKLTAKAISPTPLLVQWHKNGVPIQGRTDFSLTITNVSAADAAMYTAKFQNSAGVVTTTNAQISVIGYPRPGAVDRSFHLDSGLPQSCEIHQALQTADGKWTVALTLGYWPYSVPNYAGYSGGYGPGTALIVTRLMQDGTEDQTFTRFSSTGAAYALATDSQGRIYIATGNKRELSGLTRLLPNGTRDTNFAVTIDWVGASPEYGAWINTIVIDSRGRLLIGGHFSSVNGRTHWGLARLRSDGSVDDSFDPGFLSGTVATLNLLQDDSVVVVSGCPPQIGRDDDAIELSSGNPAHFFVVGSDGSIDLSLDGGLGFTMPSYWGHGQVKSTYVLPRGTGYALFGKGIKVVGDGTRYDTVFLDSNGRARQKFLLPGSYASAIQRDGRLLVGGLISSLHGATRNGVGRLNMDGTLDGVFDLPAQPNGLISLLAAGSNDDLLVGGMFSDIDGTSVKSMVRSFGSPGRRPNAPWLRNSRKDDVSFGASVLTEPCYEYWLEASDSPTGVWIPKLSVLGNAAIQQLYDPSTAPAQFYRLRVQ